ncbi:hypothetical protein DITRI_Ditri06bG0100000 [Diplodiscus trichospermus]
MAEAHTREPTYYINLHVDGKFVIDPILRYDGGNRHFIEEDPDTISYLELCNIVKNGLVFHNVAHIYYYEPNKRSLKDGLRLTYDDKSTIDMLNIWVKHTVIDLYVEHDADIAKVVKESLLLTGPSTNITENNNEKGGGVNGSGIGNDFESQTQVGNNIEAEVVEGESNVECEEEDDEEEVYLVNVRYLSDGDGDEELESARENLDMTR